MFVRFGVVAAIYYRQEESRELIVFKLLPFTITQVQEKGVLYSVSPMSVGAGSGTYRYALWPFVVSKCKLFSETGDRSYALVVSNSSENPMDPDNATFEDVYR